MHNPFLPRQEQLLPIENLLDVPNADKTLTQVICTKAFQAFVYIWIPLGPWQM